MSLLGSVEFEFKPVTDKFLDTFDKASEKLKNLEKEEESVNSSLEETNKLLKVAAVALGTGGVAGAAAAATKNYTYLRKTVEVVNEEIKSSSKIVRNSTSLFSNFSKSFKSFTDNLKSIKQVQNFTRILSDVGKTIKTFDAFKTVTKNINLFKDNLSQAIINLKELSRNSIIVKGVAQLKNEFSLLYAQFKPKIVKETVETFTGLQAVVEKTKDSVKKLPAFLDRVDKAAAASSIGIFSKIDSLRRLNLTLEATGFGFTVFGKALKSAGFERLGGALEKLGTIATTVLSGLGALATFAGRGMVKLGSSIRRTNDQAIGSFVNYEQQIVSLNSSLEAYKRFTGDATNSTEEFLSKAQQIGVAFGVSRDAIVESSNTLLQFTRVTGLSSSQILQLSEASARYAQASGKDLQNIAIGIDNAFRGYTQSLQLVGLQLEEEELAQTRYIRSTGRVVKELNKQEKALVTTQALLAQMNLVSDSFADSQQSIAQKLNETNLAYENIQNAVGEGAAGIRAFNVELKQSIAKTTEAALVNTGLAKSFGFFKEFIGLVTQITGAMIQVASTTFLMVTAFAAISPILGIASRKIATFLPYLKTLIAELGLLRALQLGGIGAGIAALGTAAYLGGRVYLQSQKQREKTTFSEKQFLQNFGSRSPIARSTSTDNRKIDEKVAPIKVGDPDAGFFSRNVFPYVGAATTGRFEKPTRSSNFNQQLLGLLPEDLINILEGPDSLTKKSLLENRDLLLKENLAFQDALEELRKGTSGIDEKTRDELLPKFENIASQRADDVEKGGFLYELAEKIYENDLRTDPQQAIKLLEQIGNKRKVTLEALKALAEARGDDPEAADLDIRLLSIPKSQDEFIGKQKEAIQTLEEEKRTLNQSTRAFLEHQAVVETNASSASDLNSEIRNNINTIVEETEVIEKLREARNTLEELRDPFGLRAVAQDRFIEDLARDTSRLKEDINALSLNPVNQALLQARREREDSLIEAKRQYDDEIKKIERARLEFSKPGANRDPGELKRLEQEKEAIKQKYDLEIERIDAVTEYQKKKIEEMSQVTVDVSNRLKSSFSQSLTDLAFGEGDAEENFEKFGESVKGIFKDLFAATIQNKIKFELDLQRNLFTDPDGLVGLFKRAGGDVKENLNKDLAEVDTVVTKSELSNVAEKLTQAGQIDKVVHPTTTTTGSATTTTTNPSTTTTTNPSTTTTKDFVTPSFLDQFSSFLGPSEAHASTGLTQSEKDKFFNSLSPYQQAVVMAESNGNLGIGYHDQTSSSAYGPFGLTDAAFKDARSELGKFGKSDIRFLNFREQLEVQKAYTGLNRRRLDALDVPSDAEGQNYTALAHFLGTGGVQRYLSAEKDEDRFSPDVLANHGGFDRTLEEVNKRLNMPLISEFPPLPLPISEKDRESNRTSNVIPPSEMREDARHQESLDRLDGVIAAVQQVNNTTREAAQKTFQALTEVKTQGTSGAPQDLLKIGKSTGDAAGGAGDILGQVTDIATQEITGAVQKKAGELVTQAATKTAGKAAATGAKSSVLGKIGSAVGTIGAFAGPLLQAGTSIFSLADGKLNSADVSAAATLGAGLGGVVSGSVANAAIASQLASQGINSVGSALINSGTASQVLSQGTGGALSTTAGLTGAAVNLTGTMLAGAAGAIAGEMIMSAILSYRNKASMIGSSAGAGVGAVIGTATIPLPGIGTAIGALIGSLIGGFIGQGFGKTEYKSQREAFRKSVQAQFEVLNQSGFYAQTGPIRNAGYRFGLSGIEVPDPTQEKNRILQQILDEEGMWALGLAPQASDYRRKVAIGRGKNYNFNKGVFNSGNTVTEYPGNPNINTRELIYGQFLDNPNYNVSATNLSGDPRLTQQLIGLADFGVASGAYPGINTPKRAENITSRLAVMLQVSGAEGEKARMILRGLARTMNEDLGGAIEDLNKRYYKNSKLQKEWNDSLGSGTLFLESYSRNLGAVIDGFNVLPSSYTGMDVSNRLLGERFKQSSASVLDLGLRMDDLLTPEAYEEAKLAREEIYNQLVNGDIVIEEAIRMFNEKIAAIRLKEVTFEDSYNNDGSVRTIEGTGVLGGLQDDDYKVTEEEIQAYVERLTKNIETVGQIVGDSLFSTTDISTGVRNTILGISKELQTQMQTSLLSSEIFSTPIASLLTDFSTSLKENVDAAMQDTVITSDEMTEIITGLKGDFSEILGSIEKMVPNFVEMRRLSLEIESAFALANGVVSDSLRLAAGEVRTLMNANAQFRQTAGAIYRDPSRFDATQAIAENTLLYNQRVLGLPQTLPANFTREDAYQFMEDFPDLKETMGLDALLSGLESFGAAALNLYDVQATKIRQLANDQITLIDQQIQDIQREGVLQSRVHEKNLRALDDQLEVVQRWSGVSSGSTQLLNSMQDQLLFKGQTRSRQAKNIQDEIDTQLSLFRGEPNENLKAFRAEKLIELIQRQQSFMGSQYRLGSYEYQSMLDAQEALLEELREVSLGGESERAFAVQNKIKEENEKIRDINESINDKLEPLQDDVYDINKQVRDEIEELNSDFSELLQFIQTEFDDAVSQKLERLTELFGDESAGLIMYGPLDALAGNTEIMKGILDKLYYYIVNDEEMPTPEDTSEGDSTGETTDTGEATPSPDSGPPATPTSSNPDECRECTGKDVSMGLCTRHNGKWVMKSCLTGMNQSVSPNSNLFMGENYQRSMGQQNSKVNTQASQFLPSVNQNTYDHSSHDQYQVNVNVTAQSNVSPERLAKTITRTIEESAKSGRLKSISQKRFM